MKKDFVKGEYTRTTFILKSNDNDSIYKKELDKHIRKLKTEHGINYNDKIWGN